MQGRGADQLWVLKQDVHRGKGVHVMKQREAVREVAFLPNVHFFECLLFIVDFQ